MKIFQCGHVHSEDVHTFMHFLSLKFRDVPAYDPFLLLFIALELYLFNDSLVNLLTEQTIPKTKSPSMIYHPLPLSPTLLPNHPTLQLLFCCLCSPPNFTTYSINIAVQNLSQCY